MTKVLMHPFSSLLSAYGMGLANVRATREQAMEEDFGDASVEHIKQTGCKLGVDAQAELIHRA